MKQRRFLGLLVATIVAALFFQGIAVAQVVYTYSESKVTLDNGVVAIITRPSIEARVPTILLLHGFASQKDEVGDMYKRLAAKLATEKGIASMRIDFRGWGESAGSMQESNIQGQIDDTEVAYEYLKTKDFVDISKIGIVGFSLGGGIAIVSAAQHPGCYKSMAVWSSVGDFYEDFLEELGQDNFAKASADGTVDIDLGWRDITLGDVFFKSLKSYDLMSEIANYAGAFLAIAGDQDFSLGYIDDYLARVAGHPKVKYVISNADHIYGVLGDDQSMAEEVLSYTTDWFARTLR